MKTKIDDLPAEILFNVLSRLPLTHLLHAATYTCKFMHSIINDSLFWEFHYEHYSLKNPGHLYALDNYPRLYFVDYKDTKTSMRLSVNLELHRNSSTLSCRGLFCYRSVDRISIYICNPIMDESVKLPVTGYMYPIATGLGYSPLSRKYKYLQCTHLRSGGFICKIHTLGEESWRELTFGPLCGPGVYSNGSLYWMGVGRVVSFNVESEKFRTRQTLRFVKNAVWRKVAALGNDVAYINCTEDGLQRVWVLIDEKSDVWVEKYCVSAPIPDGLKPCEFILGGLWMNEQWYGFSTTFDKFDPRNNRIYVYNSDEDTYDILQLPSDKSAERGRSSVMHVVTHVGSLISPLKLLQGLLGHQSSVAPPPLSAF